MAMIESGKSKRVRRKLPQDQLTLAEALKYTGTRGLESVNQHATNVENQTPRDVTAKQEVDKITVDKKEINRVSIAGNNGRTKGDQENAQLSESSVRDEEKGTVKEPTHLSAISIISMASKMAEAD